MAKQNEGTFGFNKADAESLIQSIGTIASTYSEARVLHQAQRRIFKTPVGGIDGRVGVACSFATCEEYWVNESGDLESLGSQLYNIYNIFSDDIAGEVFVIASRVRGVLVADAEDCGGV